jgi:hypothetical protein
MADYQYVATDSCNARENGIRELSDFYEATEQLLITTMVRARNTDWVDRSDVDPICQLRLCSSRSRLCDIRAYGVL